MPEDRRNLALSNLARIDVDIDYPELAKQGSAIGSKESYKLVRIAGRVNVQVLHTTIYGIEVSGRESVSHIPRR